ncbi:MAG: MBL fold metallo-hydrolase [Candidatus Thermoplasmatota archaeon]|nr:MBL fold metallo-hydrolase [Candidatus Thermoplasmatota archaeon]
MVLYTPGRTSSYPNEPIDSGIRIHFLGGGDEVGNVGVVIEDEKQTRLLIDYGLAPTSPPRYPSEAPPVSDAIFTHTHIDHIGMAPWLVGNHQTRLHGTSLTASLSRLMWKDTYKVSSIEGYPLPWDRRDEDEANEAWETHPYNSWVDFHNWKWQFHPAGHVPGAAMIEIQTPQYKILHSGDIDTRDSPNSKGAKPVECDILLLESTYAGKEHPNRVEEEARFIAKVVEVVERGGIAIIPAFASGRGQDVLRILHDSGLDLNVHYDGMGKTVSQKWLEHPEHLRDAQAFEDAFRWSRRVRSKSDRKRALEADVIVTTSGMLDGGPALWYLNRLRTDNRCAILFTGYQAEKSGGRQLIEKGTIPIYGHTVDIACEIDRFDLSNHADHPELVKFAESCNPKHVILFHGDPQTRPLLATSLEEKGMTVHCPENGESIHIQ